MADRRVTVFVSHGDATALRLAGSCALAAAAAGDRVDVFLFGPAVPAVVAAHGADHDEPGALLHEARQAGACRLVACSASMVSERVDPGAADRALDAVVGWPTVLEWSRGVVDRFFF
jgi:peroxiredoxin family protein